MCIIDLNRALPDYRNLWNQLGRLCYGRAYLDFSPERFVSCGFPLMRDSTFCSNPVSNYLEQGLPNGIVTLLGNIWQNILT